MTQLKRSRIHQEMYPDEFMLEAFGKLNPSTQERSAYFFELWIERKPFEIKNQHGDFATVCKELGLKQPWDYQVRGNTIRFGNAEHVAYYKLAQGGKTQ
jgi:hypothetical protein